MADDTPIHVVEVSLPLSRADQYPKSFRSPVKGLGSYCIYLYLGFDVERGSIVANLVLIAAHPREVHRDSAEASSRGEALEGRVKITLCYAGDVQVKERLHRFPFAEGPNNGSWCQAAGCRENFLAPKDFIPDGILHCRAELWCEPRSVGYEPPRKRRRHLDFGKMLWRDMTFTDMAIRAGDNGPELACHRALLAKSSAALESMLSTAMVEGQTRHIVIRNASTETLRTFLEYIYTGETPDGLPVQTLGELVFLGNQYELTALAEDCAERLSAMLCPENVVAILQVLGRHETVSPSISTILNATSAKVSKDPDLMRAVVSQLCRMPNNL